MSESREVQSWFCAALAIAFALSGPGPAAPDLARSSYQPTHKPNPTKTNMIAATTRVDRSFLKRQRLVRRIPRSWACHAELHLVRPASAIGPAFRGTPGMALSCGCGDGGCSTEPAGDRNCISFSITDYGAYGLHSVRSRDARSSSIGCGNVSGP
jgi:hypothetical protein